MNIMFQSYDGETYSGYFFRFIRHIEDILDLAEPEEQVSRQATEDFAISGEKL